MAKVEIMQPPYTWSRSEIRVTFVIDHAVLVVLDQERGAWQEVLRQVGARAEQGVVTALIELLPDDVHIRVNQESIRLSLVPPGERGRAGEET